jgi:hypothetical protein
VTLLSCLGRCAVSSSGALVANELQLLVLSLLTMSLCCLGSGDDCCTCHVNNRMCAAWCFRRKRDFLGYYKALGINLEDAGEALSACRCWYVLCQRTATLPLHHLWTAPDSVILQQAVLGCYALVGSCCWGDITQAAKMLLMLCRQCIVS